MTFVCLIYSRGYDPFTIVSEISSAYAEEHFQELWSADNKTSALFTEFGTGLLVEVLHYDGRFFVIQTQTLTYLGQGLHQDGVKYEICDDQFEARVRSAMAGHWHQPCPAFERSYEHLFVDNEGNIFAFVKLKRFFNERQRFRFRIIHGGLLEYYR